MLQGELNITPGRAVAFQFTVVNADDESVSLVFQDAGRADVAVYPDDADPDVSPIWRWSAGRAVAQVISEGTLGPGEGATFEMEWTDPEPGVYRARAELRAREHDCTAERRFTVGDRG